jgi:segregation and condensation protein A
MDTHTPTSFAVKTEVFEGPLDLLLDLIEIRKLLINDISLASVTDEYMAYVRTLQENHLQETSHFVLIAATLLLIKSKSLLPVLELTEEESNSVTDLELRLKLYQIYRDAGKELSARFDVAPLYEKTYIQDENPLFTPDSRTTLASLKEAITDVINRFPKVVFRAQVAVKKVMSLEDMIKSVEERITRQFKLSFKDFVGQKERSHVIVSFLAVLELVKQGTVLVQQESRFHDITIEREGVDTPKYT